MTTLRLPGDAASRILEFLRDGRTGSITLHASEGTIASVEIKDSIRFKPSTTKQLDKLSLAVVVSNTMTSE